MSLVATQPVERKHDPGPEGLWERLDASRREVVELCGEKGKALFVFLLQSSTMLSEQDDIAICSLQRLHDVAAQLGASPDTVKRYVAVFRALSLVSHYHDHRREVKLHIPLGSYSLLTNFSAFDELIGKRQKQRQLALKVKTRYITRYGDPTLVYSDEARTTFQELSTILEGEHIEPLKRQRLQMKLADLMSQLVRKAMPSLGDSNESIDHRQGASFNRRADMAPREGDSDDILEAFCHAKQTGQEEKPPLMGDLNESEGDSFSHGSASSLRQDTSMGDSNSQEGDPKLLSSTPSTLQPGRQEDSMQQEGDRIPSPSIQIDVLPQPIEKVQGDSISQKGDSLTQQRDTKEPVGDSIPSDVLKEGDSISQRAVEAQENAPYTYNVHYLISNLKENSVIRKRLAQFLASVLEKNEYENGYPTFSKYLKAFKEYAPEVIGRAFLVTMVLLHRKHWHIERPGATFTDQCRVLSGQKPLAHYTLDEVEEWLKTWGHLAYPELLVAVATATEQQVREPAPLRTESRKTAMQNKYTGYTGSSSGRRRTFGLQYTGRPVTGDERVRYLGSPMPPSEKSK
jgi:hypothetical protein